MLVPDSNVDQKKHNKRTGQHIRKVSKKWKILIYKNRVCFEFLMFVKQSPRPHSFYPKSNNTNASLHEYFEWNEKVWNIFSFVRMVVFCFSWMSCISILLDTVIISCRYCHYVKVDLNCLLRESLSVSIFFQIELRLFSDHQLWQLMKRLCLWNVKWVEGPKSFLSINS